MGFDITTNNTETDPKILLGEFFKTFDSFSDEEKARFSEAWDILCQKTAGLTRNCGLPYYLHPMRVASILAQGQLDIDSVISGLLHSIFEIEGVSEDEVKERFGETVFKIVRDTSKITGMKINATTIQQADSIRKCSSP